MREELERKLIIDFPMLYRQARQETPLRNPISYGFECGDGWFDLVYDLSNKLTEYAIENKLTIEAEQVKEKFGGIRFYISSNANTNQNFYLQLLLQQAEVKSCQICEVCGKPGKLQGDNWYSVKCAEHK